MEQSDRAEGSPVYLHCGYHKTATTYFQHLLRINDAALRPHLGVINRVTRETDAARLACQDYVAHPDPGPAQRDALMEVLRGYRDHAAMRRGDVPVLISDEAFIGFHPGQREARLRLYPRAPDIAEMLVAAFAPRPVRIVMMHRDEAGWLRSVHNQGVKNDLLPHRLDAFRGKLRDPLDLHAVTAAIAERIGSDNVIPLEMNDDRTHWFGAGGQILDLVGVPEDVMRGLERPTQSNESMVPWALEMMRVTNRMPLPYGANRWIRYHLLGHQLRLKRWESRRKALEGQPGIVPR